MTKIFQTKVCPYCGEEKELTEFYKQKTGRYNSYCKPCDTAYKKEHYHKNKKRIRDANKKYVEENQELVNEKKKSWYKERGRENQLKKVYGITLAQYNELLRKQNNCCAICGKHESEFSKRLAVDHNHFTGEIRGLLCFPCNHKKVGQHRDGELLRKIADYIEQGTGWFVPKKKRTIKRKPK